MYLMLTRTEEVTIFKPELKYSPFRVVLNIRLAKENPSRGYLPP